MYKINIVGLSNKAHHFHYSLDDSFFGQYGREIFAGGKFAADIELIKHETFLEGAFKITGSALLTCDRSLEPFEEPLAVTRRMVFKYGDEPREMSDEVTVISRDTVDIDVGQLMYEFIALEVPMRRIHPRLRHADDDSGHGKLIYTATTEPADKESIDPRWEKLKNLK